MIADRDQAGDCVQVRLIPEEEEELAGSRQTRVQYFIRATILFRSIYSEEASIGVGRTLSRPNIFF
jgi:hypothetical protein